jgi:hypothetical protein
MVRKDRINQFNESQIALPFFASHLVSAIDPSKPRIFLTSKLERGAGGILTPAQFLAETAFKLGLMPKYGA